jgi:hypothetical protein
MKSTILTITFIFFNANFCSYKNKPENNKDALKNLFKSNKTSEIKEGLEYLKDELAYLYENGLKNKKTSEQKNILTKKILKMESKLRKET